jgi:diguanylate cyclase (GGDEF)-like protein
MLFEPHGPLRQALEQSGVRKAFRAGDILFRQGDAGDCMYLIESGHILLLFDGEKPLKRLAPGEFFGEIALLSMSSRRTATAVVEADAELLLVGQSELLKLEEREPRVMCALMRETCTNLLTSENALIGELEARNGELERTLDYLRRTQEERDAKQLEALTDELTGLYNRRCLQEQMARLLGQGVEPGLALLVVDLDLFKPINDTHGHAAGDLVLRKVSAVLRAAVRRTDLPCRIGGDEFALVLPNTRESDARARAIEIHRRINELLVQLPNAQLAVHASVGGTMLRGGEDLAALHARADESLYLAKQAGRSRAVWSGAVCTPEGPDQR